MSKIIKRLTHAILSILLSFSGVSWALSDFKIVYISNTPNIIATEHEHFFAKLSTYMTELRRQNNGKPVFLIHGGDSLSPSAVSLFDSGKNIIALADQLGVSAYGVSQRDLFFGLDQLSLRANEASFPVISSNIQDVRTGAPSDSLLPYYFLKVGDKKIALLSFITGDVNSNFTSPNVQVMPFKATLSERIKQVKRQGATQIILMTDVKERKLQDAIPKGELDYILRSSGQHTGFKDVNLTPFISFGGQTNQVVTLSYSAKTGWSGDYALLDKVQPNKQVADFIDKYKVNIDTYATQAIAQSSLVLSSERNVVRQKESALGSLFADALRSYTQAEVALFNSGGIRGNRRYPKGHMFTKRDIQQELPFGNYHNVIALTGTEIQGAMENSLSKIGENDGRFLHVSGMQVFYDLSQPVGQRVELIKINGVPLIAHKKYKVALPDFLASGGNDYTMLKGKENLNSEFDKRRMWHIVVEYLTNQRVIVAPTAGRLKEVSR